jgi:hypothetical protein
MLSERERERTANVLMLIAFTAFMAFIATYRGRSTKIPS